MEGLKAGDQGAAEEGMEQAAGAAAGLQILTSDGHYVPAELQDAVAAQKSLESAGIDTVAELFGATAPSIVLARETRAQRDILETEGLVSMDGEPDGPHTSVEWQVWAYSTAAPEFIAEGAAVVGGAAAVGAGAALAVAAASAEDDNAKVDKAKPTIDTTQSRSVPNT